MCCSATVTVGTAFGLEENDSAEEGPWEQSASANNPCPKVWALHSYTPELLASCHSHLPTLALLIGEAWSFSSVKELSHPPLPTQPSTPQLVWSLAWSIPLPHTSLGPLLLILLCLIVSKEAQIIT